MKNSWLLLGFFCFITLSLSSQNPEAYRLFKANGKKTSFKKMLKETSHADVAFFGELHNNPIAHWLQTELTRNLFEIRPLVLGAEMFESDNQEALTSYVNNLIDIKSFQDSVRLWDNFKTDYKPLVEFARKQNIPFIATNVPRKYASLVYRKGIKSLDSLSEEEKKWLAPLPVFIDKSLSTYAEMDKLSGHGGDNLIASQALKDATMAYFILKNTEPGKLFLHFNGSYHSKRGEGIVWQLRIKRPDLKVITIATVEQEDLATLEAQFQNEADFIIVVPKNMTKTY